MHQRLAGEVVRREAHKHRLEQMLPHPYQEECTSHVLKQEQAPTRAEHALTFRNRSAIVGDRA
jgi:hypothetical protein